MTTQHPMQPVVRGQDGVVRFKANKIVRFLLESSKFDMNDLANMRAAGAFSTDDAVQFAQLIGYSVCGAADLSYMPHELIAAADAQAEALVEAGDGGR